MANSLRAEAIIRTRLKWVNGTVLHYCFFGGSSRYAVPKKQADAIRGAFRKWKAVGIGLEFQEVDQLSEAEVRIGYSTADGESASSVGREVLSVPLNQPTTVYGLLSATLGANAGGTFPLTFTVSNSLGQATQNGCHVVCGCRSDRRSRSSRRG